MNNDDRYRMLIELDLAAARRMVPCMPDGTPMSDDGLLAGLHKTRYHVVALPRALRLASAEWLRANGYSDLRGIPLLPPGELPE